MARAGSQNGFYVVKFKGVYISMYYSIGYVLCFYANFIKFHPTRTRSLGLGTVRTSWKRLKFSALPVTTCCLEELRSIRNTKNSNNPDRKISGGPTRVTPACELLARDYHVLSRLSPSRVNAVHCSAVPFAAFLPATSLDFLDAHNTRQPGCYHSEITVRQRACCASASFSLSFHSI